MLSFFIIVPLLALLILNLPPRDLMKRIVFSVGLLLCFVQTIFLTLGVMGTWNVLSIPTSQMFQLNIAIDNLSLLLLICNSVVIFITILVSRDFFSEPKQKFNFINLLLIALSGMNGIAIARDIFSLYVFIEITSISSFILIGFNRERDAFEGAFKYIILSSIATVLMLGSTALILLQCGDTSFDVIQRTLAMSAQTPLFLFAIGLFLCGLFIKGGIIPFHGWLPDAYSSAPAPVSIFLAGIATKSVGIYTLMRLVYSVFGFSTSIQSVLLVLGLVSAVLGALAALTQKDFKRMLAYSSISQIGYIVLGLGCATPLGFGAAAFHFFNHAIFKSLLFVNSAALEKQVGVKDMDRLGGLAEKMPLTGAASVIASLSTAGIPPLSGFWSKLLIIIALWMSGYYVFAVIAILTSVLTLGYLLTMQRSIFFGKLAQGLEEVRKSGWEITLATIILTVITVGVGILFPFNLWNLIIR